MRELFQFDCADLDFGIYRIMNHKRAVIERFITTDLPQAITQELERGALTEQAQAAQALEAIAALTAERRTTDKGGTVTYLEYHLRQYTRRNTSDFFIHKDLKGFLSRELDFYLKNEVLNLEELEASGEGLSEGWFQLLRLIKRIGLRIEFLAQIEDFQKMLWEKKKFVTETFYIITVGNIPEAFYAEIAACQAQWDEWQALFALDHLPRDLLSGDPATPEGRAAFLKAHPTLVLDTRHFSQDFTDRLLASFDDIDESTDGLLVHSENWQALNLLQEKYRERVKCIYIDPPYNTGSDEFLYRDNYQHSSWLAMMENRLRISRSMLDLDGSIFISIDDNEQSSLRRLGESVFGAEHFVSNVIWQKKYTRANDARWFSDNHDFIVVFAKDKERFVLSLLPRTEEQEAAYSNPDNDPRGPWKANPLHAKSGKGQTFTCTFANGVTWSPPPGTYARYSTDTLKKLEQENRIWFGPDGKSTPARKSFLSEVQEGVVPVTIWKYDEVGHNHEAINELKYVFPENPYFNPKPTRLIRRIVNLAQGRIVLDFFAGSGTTAHAVINLNREDGGRRKFILVEMADYFDTVLLPRIKKVTFAPEWKDGKPKRMATAEEAERSPRLVKVIRLEFYEDALNNLTF